MISNWKTCQLGELVTFTSGGTPSKKKAEYWNGSIPWISAKTMKDEHISTSDLMISEEGLKNGSRLAPQGSILFLIRGSGLFNGIPICLVDKPVAFNQDVKCINSISEIENKYVFYWLLSQASTLSAIVGVTTIGAGKFDMDVIKRLEISYPEKEVRNEIIRIADAISDKIRLNTAINENLEQQAQAIFKSWFVDFEPFGGVMPEDWKIKDIYSIANIIYGAPFKSKLFNTEKDGKPIVRIRDLKSNELTTFTTEIHPKGYLIQNGDIVVGMDGEFKPYIWGNNEAWLNQRVCVFDNIRENGKFFLYLTIKPLLNIVEQTEVATTVIHIGKSDFDSFEINLPNENILDKFDTITMPIYKLIVKNKLENKRLAELRDTLLPKLMNGETDVSKVKI